MDKTRDDEDFDQVSKIESLASIIIANLVNQMKIYFLKITELGPGSWVVKIV